MFRLIGVIGFSILCFQLTAQFATNIRTGRPGQAIGAYTLGSKVFQLQSGFNNNIIAVDENTKNKILEHSTVLRLGLLEKLEVSGVINWRADRYSQNQLEERITGISNTQIGLRYNLLEATSKLPALGIQGRILLNAQSEAYRREELGMTFILMSGKRLNEWLAILANVGVIWAGNNSSANSFYRLSSSYSLSEKWGAFTEVYGKIEPFNINFDAGFSYLVNSNLQLDASVAWQGQDGILDWYIDGGVSWRIVWRD